MTESTTPESEEVEVDTKQLIIDAYLEIIAAKKAIPVQSDFYNHDIKRHVIRYHFGGMDGLHYHMSTHHHEEIEEYFSTVDKLFQKKEEVKQAMKKQRFIITTAVADAPADTDFLNSMKSYCKKNDAQILILPCESITNSFDRRTATFDKEFRHSDYTFITDDTPLNENLLLCSIQVSAKQVKPITGLNRLGNREGSYIFASPKQFLEYIPCGNSRTKNYAIMTPGACTKPKYYSQTFVSKRLSYIADNDHTIGAIIVELENDRTLHFRQLQADEQGTFIDLGVQYNPDGTTEKVTTNVVLGDIHSQHLDTDCTKSFIESMEDMNIGECFLHDIFDGYSINHHITNIGARARRMVAGVGRLDEELELTANTVRYIHAELNADTTYIVKSNHDEFLDRYLDEARYVDDPVNHYTSILIAPALFSEELGSPLEYGFHLFSEDLSSDIIFLSRGDEMKISEVECGAHGDLGLNGAKSSLNGLEKVYGKCVVAHTHSAAIQRDVFRVGTFTELDMGYNRGPSSWTQTACLIYDNGQRQLVNYIDGKFYKDQK